MCPSPLVFSGWVVQQKDEKVVHAREVVIPSGSALGWKKKTTLKGRIDGFTPRRRQKVS